MPYRMDRNNRIERVESTARASASDADCKCKAKVLDELNRPPLTWRERFAEIEANLRAKGKPLSEAREVR